MDRRRSSGGGGSASPRKGEPKKTSRRKDSVAAQEVREFLEQREGSSLRAWLMHFDTNNDCRINQKEFTEGMVKLGFTGDPLRLFGLLDVSNCGEVTLEEVDEKQQALWVQFRIWCARRFANVDEMINRLGSVGTDVPTFAESLRREGWPGGFEDLLWHSLGYYWSEPSELRAHLKWLGEEHRRRARREHAKQRALAEQQRRQAENAAARAELADFKRFLKAKYGSFVRAWRMALSPDDAMVLQKSEFMKACNRLPGWNGNAKLVWKAFDQDDSGLISIDELDPGSAEILAHFRNFIMERFPNPIAAFRALDKDGSRSITEQEFSEALKDLGFEYPTRQLFMGLDKYNEKKLMEDNLDFLAEWKPLPFITKQASFKAKQEFKELLLSKYKSYMMAWRRLMDRDASNRCNWHAFYSACKKIGFTGDIAGAWRALDADLSGYITLRELDEKSSDLLYAFKRWADEDFGSLRSAFAVFDSDGSKQIDFREFRHCCRVHGFTGNVQEIYAALDFQGDGFLSVNELAFLDDWPEEEELLDEPDSPISPLSDGEALNGFGCLGGGAARRGSMAMDTPRNYGGRRPSTVPVMLDKRFSVLAQARRRGSAQEDVAAAAVSAFERAGGQAAAGSPTANADASAFAGAPGCSPIPEQPHTLPPSLSLLVRDKKAWRGRDAVLASRLGIGEPAKLGVPLLGDYLAASGDVDFEAVSRRIRASPQEEADWSWWENAVAAEADLRRDARKALRRRGVALPSFESMLKLQAWGPSGRPAQREPLGSRGPSWPPITKSPDADELLEATYGARPGTSPRSAASSRLSSSQYSATPGPRSGSASAWAAAVTERDWLELGRSAGLGNALCDEEDYMLNHSQGSCCFSPKEIREAFAPLDGKRRGGTPQVRPQHGRAKRKGPGTATTWGPKEDCLAARHAAAAAALAAGDAALLAAGGTGIAGPAAAAAAAAVALDRLLVLQRRPRGPGAGGPLGPSPRTRLAAAR